MKKMILLFACLLALPFTVLADDDKPIRVDQLPQPAQQFLNQHFAGFEVAFAKEESDWFDRSYEVFFVDGNKVEFGKNGDWKEIDCSRSELPAGVVPAEIRRYVEQKYTGLRLVKIDRDTRDYEVELSNGIELKFDLKYNLIGYDN